MNRDGTWTLQRTFTGTDRRRDTHYSEPYKSLYLIWAYEFCNSPLHHIVYIGRSPAKNNSPGALETLKKVALVNLVLEASHPVLNGHCLFYLTTEEDSSPVPALLQLLVLAMQSRTKEVRQREKSHGAWQH